MQPFTNTGSSFQKASEVTSGLDSEDVLTPSRLLDQQLVLGPLCFFPFSGSPLLQNLILLWCNSSQHRSLEHVPGAQSLASFPSLPSARSGGTERSAQLSLLWAGGTGLKSGAVNLPPGLIPGFYRNTLWWQVVSLAHLRWNVEIPDFCVFLFMTHAKDTNNNPPAELCKLENFL